MSPISTLHIFCTDTSWDKPKITLHNISLQDSPHDFPCIHSPVRYFVDYHTWAPKAPSAHILYKYISRQTGIHPPQQYFFTGFPTAIPTHSTLPTIQHEWPSTRYFSVRAPSAPTQPQFFTVNTPQKYHHTLYYCHGAPSAPPPRCSLQRIWCIRLCRIFRRASAKVCIFSLLSYSS